MKRFLALLLAAGIAVLVLGGQAFAATTAAPTATITLNAGSLSISSTGSVGFPATALTGDDIPVAATSAPTFSLIDATGSGAGWNVTFISTDFTAAGGKTIAATNFTFTSNGTAVTKVKGQNVDATNGPKETTLSNATLDVSRKIITTLASYGKGTYTYAPAVGDFNLTVPADSLAGAYTATITATITTGP